MIICQDGGGGILEDKTASVSKGLWVSSQGRGFRDGEEDKK